MSKHVGFNYDALKDAKVRTEAKKHAEQINRLLKSSTEGIVEIGKRLNIIRASMTSAEFRGWIGVEFCWSQSVSANYMQSARVFGELDCLSKFQPTALMMLARNNIPKKIVEDMIARARAGEVITYSEVKKVLADDPSFKPSRIDAGVARKTDSERSIAGIPSPAQPNGKITIATLQQSLDAFSVNLSQLELDKSELETLSQRFLDLAFQLRTLSTRASTETPPGTQPKSKKGSASKTAA